MSLTRQRCLKTLSRYGARWALGLLLTALAALQVAGVGTLDVLDRMDTAFADLRLRLVTPVLDRRIVIVDIDEASLAAHGRFPWSRNVLARLVRQLTEHYQCAAVGFDISFPEPDTSSGYQVLARLAEHELKDVPGLPAQLARLQDQLDYDGLLAQALQDQPVVLGLMASGAQRKGVLPKPAFVVDDLNGRTLDALTANGYVANLARLQNAAAGGGIINTALDADGILRSAPLLMRIGDGYYPTLSLATLAVALDAKAIKPLYMASVDSLSARERANGGLDALAILLGRPRGALRVPVGEYLKTVIEFRGRGGPAGGAFTYVSAADVLSGKAAPAVLNGAIVLVGTTVAGLHDLRATPVNSDYPGVEVHANLIKSMLDQSFKQRPDFAFAAEFAQVLLVGLILSVALAVLPPLAAVLCALATAAGAFGFNSWLYLAQNWVISVAPLLMLILALFIFNLGWGYFFEFRKGRALVSRFGEYVAPELVAAMADDPEKYNMDGESRELTVLFVDVRGFTTISEGLTPKALREYINLYLTAMSEDIRDRHQGTLDKYIGDAVMAFWGAPVAFADHAERAVASAMLMQASAARLNGQFVARGWPALKIGIGLNTGLMHVGDMGSRIRRAYTVMGDAVNLAARLEGITKVYGVDIAVGEATRRAAPDWAWRELDLVRVKGKHEPVAIFEPLGRIDAQDDAARAALDDWHAALALVRAQQWAPAQQLLERLSARAPGQQLYRLYLARVAAYLAEPPGPHWDGATNFETK